MEKFSDLEDNNLKKLTNENSHNISDSDKSTSLGYKYDWEIKLDLLEQDLSSIPINQLDEENYEENYQLQEYDQVD